MQAAKTSRSPAFLTGKQDILQALALIDWHLQREPHALVDDAWNQLAARGAGWVKRARASLAPGDLVSRFESAMKLRGK